MRWPWRTRGPTHELENRDLEPPVEPVKTLTVPVATTGEMAVCREDCIALVAALTRAGVVVEAPEGALVLRGAARYLDEVSEGGPLFDLFDRERENIHRLVRYLVTTTAGEA
jgi:hypothetical protein